MRALGLAAKFAVAGILASALAFTPGNSTEKKGGSKGNRPARRPRTILYKLKKGARASQLRAFNGALKARAVTPLRKLRGLSIDVVQFAKDDVSEETVCAELMATGAVQFAEPDALVAPVLVPNDPSYASQWQHAKINSPAAWDTTTGSPSVLVGVCDTGVSSSHPDLAPNLELPGYNAVDGSTDTEPIYNHGTGVAGCIGAAGNNGTGVAGVAWSTKILPVRITNTTDGLAYVSDAAEGIRHAADLGAKVVNLSYRMAGYATIADAGQYLRDRGGLLFVAAGNDGTDPGWADYASFIAIGATSSSDTKASFSNTGAYIDVVAPGVSVYSTTSTSGYTYMSGTSFSSPIAAGLAALIYSVNPAFTPDQVESFIFSTCVDLGDPGEDDLYGHGRIDAAAAIAAAAGTSTPPPPNTAPVAVATATPTAGTAPLTVALDGSASSDADGTITGYQWDLGDGTTATTAIVSHVYDAAGTYAATLTVTDDQGATATDSVQVTVAAPPPPPEPQAVLFVADIEMALKVVRNRTYATATVTIVSIDGAPCPNATVAGTWTGPKTGSVSGTTGADGTVTLTSPPAKGTFTYTLTVTSVAATDCTYEPSLNVETTDSISNGTTTNAAPEAVLLATPTSGVAPLLVELDASGSSDPDGTIVSHAWDFGDGTTGASAATTHTYLSPGTYTVTLTVTDDKGARDTATETIVVVESTGQTVCVSSIALSLLPAPGGYVCQAVVKIVDGTGAPVAGAEIIGEWSGLVSGVAVATTGADGTAVFTSKKSRKSGAFTFTVTDVSAAGYAYDPANNTESSDSIVKTTSTSRRRR